MFHMQKPIVFQRVPDWYFGTYTRRVHSVGILFFSEQEAEFACKNYSEKFGHIRISQKLDKLELWFQRQSYDNFLKSLDEVTRWRFCVATFS